MIPRESAVLPPLSIDLQTLCSAREFCSMSLFQGTDAYIPFLGTVHILGCFGLRDLDDLLFQGLHNGLDWIDGPTIVGRDGFPDGKALAKSEYQAAGIQL